LKTGRLQGILAPPRRTVLPLEKSQPGLEEVA
jgi:hypothetical protein